ncbi:MAG: toll/interleukin-1 receptor domain-containing protein [Candidatus Synoicihabitans palmerolidicus]|nr:toll/interleukin-1 receptor domain-containing protein [Candidatus Synoicihabitans palmerolidicus]MCC5023775.1 toll/interleukin-1 receptor domain-containing protein [Candidatus Synoicihabitans palmerolidicus]MCC5023877.1 toll/interleukin-1 receptor domain-containing protein [Candidatus Synoicihabitans palmerolidicus]MCC5025215.1 toll/interleukin-1 receptor domain-containing protein [Candidatus Synoicihabitans palmerolidicus]MCC5025913.1 toll/interleukin-1 receptor domain-containing protein [C
MDTAPHHVFFSYSREDNKHPVDDEGHGWVTALYHDLKERHRRYSGRELNIFFDQESLELGKDWRRALGAGIRESNLFLAFLSPNYLTGDNCIWEWE